MYALSLTVSRYITRSYSSIATKNAITHIKNHTSTPSKKIQEITLKDSHTIRHLRALEVQAGWNPGKYDITYYLQSKQVTIFALTVNDTKVGYISLFKADNFSFLGSLIVSPEERGKGYGEDLWEFMLNKTSGKVGLYGTAAMAPYYAKSGFVQKDTIRRVSFTLPTVQASLPLPTFSYSPISKYQIKSLCAFDHEITGVSREKVLTTLVKDYDHTITYFETKKGKCSGYGNLRMLMNGFRLSLYASNPESATSILKGIIKIHQYRSIEFKKIPNTVIIDIPQKRIPYITNVLKDLNLSPYVHDKKDFNLCTMFLDKTTPKNKINLEEGCYGIHSLEIG